MSVSDEKLTVEIEPVSFDGKPSKLWVKVTLRSCGRCFYPSFEDLWRIIRGISYCEDKKYPNGQGRDMVKRILVDSVYCGDWPVLAKRYNLPDRSSETPREGWDREVARQLELVDLQIAKTAADELKQRRLK